MATKKPATATRKSVSKSKAGSRTAAAAKTAVKTKPAAKTSRATTKTKVTVAADTAGQAPVEKSSECKHTWLIEPPNGPTSNGSCTVCGQTREFRNSYEYTPSWTARSGKAAAGKAAAAKATASSGGPARSASTGKESDSAGK
ncbi:MAG: hypothetical protein IIB26_06100 [Chloroflexi bacterium]|nr:hypothetical protein [Chloroflexota bacterium]